jgi:hypothetical protein
VVRCGLGAFIHVVIQSTLLAVIQSVLLVFFNNLNPEKFNPDSPGGQALLVLTYLAFFFSISATFSSLLLTDEFGEIHVRASQRESMLEPLDSMAIHEDQGELLKRYGARRILKPVIWHCEHYSSLPLRNMVSPTIVSTGFLMLLLGYLSLVAQLLAYLWIMESRPVAIAMSCVAGFILLPLLSLYPSK